jgi:hypothetical protein
MKPKTLEGHIYCQNYGEGYNPFYCSKEDDQGMNSYQNPLEMIGDELELDENATYKITYTIQYQKLTKKEEKEWEHRHDALSF